MPTTTAMTLAARRRDAIFVVIVIFARPSSRLLRAWVGAMAISEKSALTTSS